MMKPSVRIVNCARGGIINEQDLADALKEGVKSPARLSTSLQGTLHRAPPNPLLDAPNIIVVPHLGASTTEAQFNVAVESAESIANFLINNVIVNSVNMPSINKEQYEQIKNFITLSEKMGGMVSQLIDGQVEQGELCYGGDITEYDVAILTRAALKGLFQNFDGDSVNYVNAVNVAQARGIKVIELKQDFPTDFTNLVTIKVTSDKKQTLELWGSVYSNRLPKVVKYNEYFFEFDPEGVFLMISNEDVPGVIGKIGTILGKYKVNIAGMRLGRNESTKLAMTLLNIDNEVGADAQKELLALDEIKALKIIKL
jgi:D-3-phosphoglycerate dehydrogenase